eukprot:1147362-Pelagomonas_calceolata.AAC.12
MKVPSGWAALPLEIGPRNIQWKIVWRVHASSSGHRQPLTDPRFGLRHFMELRLQLTLMTASDKSKQALSQGYKITIGFDVQPGRLAARPAKLCQPHNFGDETKYFLQLGPGDGCFQEPSRSPSALSGL